MWRQKLRLPRWLVAGVALALALGLSLCQTNGAVFANQEASVTLTFESDTAGYDSPSVTVSATVDDEGVIVENLQIVPYDKAFSNESAKNPSYNGGNFVVAIPDRASGLRTITFDAVYSTNRISGDQDSYKSMERTVEFTYGETKLSDLANNIFTYFATNANTEGSVGYTYTIPDGTTTYVAIINNCNSSYLATETDGPICSSGEYEASRKERRWTSGSGNSSSLQGYTYTFNIDGYEWTLECGINSCYDNNSVEERTSDTVISYYVHFTTSNLPSGDATDDAAISIGSASSDDEEDATQVCYNAAGSTGWLICPVMELAGDAASSLYDGILSNFLTIDPELLKTTSGTYEAWNIFRNIANGVLIIIMLVIVLSQLTGFGVSNYGIKKMLPRLVTLAILLNVSYIAAQLLVDVSNIVGSSIYGFLDDIAAGIDWKVNVTGAENIAGLFSFFVVVGIAAGAVLAGGALVGIVAAIVFSALFAIVFTLFLLAVRQALVVLLVVATPILIVLYVLPNTEKVAQRALQLFGGMLMLYPLAGLLIGGSQLAAAVILASTSSGIVHLIAVVTAVVPLFLLPWLVKSVFSFSNSLLGKLTSGGDRLAGTVKGGVRSKTRDAINNSERAKMAEQRRQERRTLKLANLKRKSDKKRLEHAKGVASTAQNDIDTANRDLAAATTDAQRRDAQRRLDEAITQQQAANNTINQITKQYDEEATNWAAQRYGSSDEATIGNAIAEGFQNGSFSSDEGQSRLRAMATMLGNRGGGGAQALQAAMQDTALGESNKENLAAWRGALTEDTLNNLKGSSVVTSDMAKRVAASPDGKAFDYDMEKDATKAVQDTSVHDLAGLSSKGFEEAAKYMSQDQYLNLAIDDRLMNQLTPEHREHVRQVANSEKEWEFPTTPEQ